MPVLVPLARQSLTTGTILQPGNRSQWLRVDQEDTQVRLRIARAATFDGTARTHTGAIAPWWNEGDAIPNILKASMWVSYDNAQSWEELGRITTGPEVKWKRVSPDPDAPRIMRPTMLISKLLPQQGNQARLVRYEMEVYADIETEVELESLQFGPPRSIQPRDGGSVTYEASNSNASANTTSVSSGNINPSGSNMCAVAFGFMGDVTLGTSPSMNIDNASSTSIASHDETGQAIDAGTHAYYRVAPVGVHDADWSVTGTQDDMGVSVMTYSDVDQTTPVDNSGSSGNGYFPTEVSETATSETDDRVCDGMCAFGYSLPAITGTPATANHRETATSGELLCVSGDEAGAASVGIGYDYTTSPPSTAYVWFNLNVPAAAAGGPRNPLGHPLKGPFGGPIG